MINKVLHEKIQKAAHKAAEDIANENDVTEEFKESIIEENYDLIYNAMVEELSQVISIDFREKTIIS